MKAIVVTDQAAGTAGMTLVERSHPQAAINDVVVQVHASGSGLVKCDVVIGSSRSPANILEGRVTSRVMWRERAGRIPKRSGERRKPRRQTCPLRAGAAGAMRRRDVHPRRRRNTTGHRLSSGEDAAGRAPNLTRSESRGSDTPKTRFCAPGPSAAA